MSTTTATPAPVSVVVPAHNASATLAAAVQSALTQVPAPAEVVIVDDGSTDDTVAVARSAAEACGARVDEPTAVPAEDLADRPALRPEADEGAELHQPTGQATASGTVVRILTEPQSGPSTARNTGIKATRYPWIAFLDADDVWHAGKLQTQLAVAAAHPGAVAVASDWVRQGVTAPPVRETGTEPLTTITEKDLLVLNRFQTSTVLARSADIRGVGGFDPRVDGVEDWDLWRRLAARGPIVKVDEALVSYTDVGDSYSKNLVRVYETAMTMVAGAVAGLDRRTSRRLRAWHHLRFAVAFTLAGNRQQARRCLVDVYRAGLLSAVPGATAVHLLPFLSARVKRRAAGRRPGAAIGSDPLPS